MFLEDFGCDALENVRLRGCQMLYLSAPDRDCKARPLVNLLISSAYITFSFDEITPGKGTTATMLSIVGLE